MNYKPIKVSKQGVMRLCCVVLANAVLFYPYIESRVKSTYYYFKHYQSHTIDVAIPIYEPDGYTKSGIPKYTINLDHASEIAERKAQALADEIREEVEINLYLLDWNSNLRMSHNWDIYHIPYSRIHDPHFWNYDCTKHLGEVIKVKPPYIPSWVVKHTLLARIVPDYSPNC